MIEVLLQLDPRDGNDPIEATMEVPQVPRKGDLIEVWVDDGRGAYQSRPELLEVEEVCWCSYAPERVAVQVRADTYDRSEVKRIFKAIRDGDEP